MTTKICNTCNIEKPLTSFEKGVNRRNGQEFPYWRNKCKECDRPRVLKKNAKSRAKRRPQNIAYQKQFAIDNPEYIENYKKEYYQNNKEKIIARVKKNTYKRRKEDPVFRLKTYISTRIATAISKEGKTTLSILSYTLQELKEHLEKQFEYWMTWNNYGVYRTAIWDDNNPETWTWQLDHIIPHSRFNYSSVEDQTFKDCWALSNLRPYSSKQNLIDGNNRDKK